MKFKILITLLLSIFILSCEKKVEKLPEGTYKITGDAKGVYNGIRVYLKAKNAYRGRENYSIVDTAVVANEKFEFSGTFKTNEVWYLEANSAVGKIPLYINNDPIHIILNKDNLQLSVIENSPTNNAIKNHDITKVNLDNDIKKLQKEFLANKNKSASYKQDYGVTLKRKTDSLKNLDKNFIKANSKNYYSVVLLEKLTQDRKADIKELDALVNSLDQSLINTPLGNKLNGNIKQVIEIKNIEESVSVGKKAPNFSGKTPEGKTISLNDVKGKLTLIDFWASWCKPCRQENPNVVKVYNKFHDKGLEIISVSLDGRRGEADAKAAWTNAIKEDNLTWNHISSLAYFNEPIAKLYGVRGIPATFLLDENGVIVARNLRGEALERKVNELIYK